MMAKRLMDEIEKANVEAINWMWREEIAECFKTALNGGVPTNHLMAIGLDESVVQMLSEMGPQRVAQHLEHILEDLRQGVYDQTPAAASALRH